MYSLSDPKSCELTTVFYRGIVSAIVASDASFHVAFDDGEVNDGLDRNCLRPWKPFQVGERVQVRESENQYLWSDGVVVGIHSNTEESVLVDVNTNNRIMTGINTANIRRRMAFQTGDEVSVLDEVEELWYPATILQVTSEGNYLVQYGYGETEADVRAHRIVR